MAVGDIKKVRRAYADEETRKRRETTAKKREEKRLIEPEKILPLMTGICDPLIP